MLAALSVNWTYIAILIVPSVLVLVFMALTWRSRLRQQREQDERRRQKQAAQRSGQGGRRRRRK